MSRTAQPPRLPSRAEWETLTEAQSMTPAECRRKVRAKAISVSYHESGHVLAALALGLPVEKVWVDLRLFARFSHHIIGGGPPPPPGAIEIRMQTVGAAHIPAGAPISGKALDRATAITYCAGAAAECRRLGIPFHPKHLGGDDRRDAMLYTGSMSLDPANPLVARLIEQTARLVEGQWERIERLARALLDRIGETETPVVEMGREEIEVCLSENR
jgi:hypothetical protein